jgi:hypothetical protein
MIRFLFTLFCLGCALSATPCLAQNLIPSDELPPKPSADPTDDVQWWPDLQFNWRIKPRFALVGFATRRSGQYADGPSAKQIGGGFNWALHRNFTFASQFRRVSTTPTPTRRAEEYRFLIDATPRLNLGAGFLVTDRNRFEIRCVNGIYSTRYRNRSQIERPLRFTLNGHEQPVTPYFSVEMFYDSRTQAWSRKQIYIGARVPLIEHVTFNGFYMRQWDAVARPGYVHVIGSFLIFDF